MWHGSAVLLGSHPPDLDMTRLLLLAALVASPALAQGPAAGSDDPCRQPALTAVGADLSPACAVDAPPFADARLDPSDTGWGYSTRLVGTTMTDSVFVSFTLDDSNDVTLGPVVAAPDGELVEGCDFTDDDFETLTCISAAGLLFTVDLGDGSVASIGSGDYAGEGVTDLTYSVADDTWYTIAAVDRVGNTCDTETSLYSVDPADGSSTLIGTDDVLPCGIGLAAAPDGVLYAYGILTDDTVTISTTDGSQTLLGPAGFNFNFAQAMDCDASDGTCYAFAYAQSGINGLFTVDLVTGAFTQVGLLADNAQYTAAAIATSRPVAAETGPLGAVSLDLIGANPARDRVRLGLTVEQAQDVSVRVYDALGREVAVLHEGAVAAGARLDLGADVSAWAPGTYLVRATGEGVSLSQAVTVVR